MSSSDYNRKTLSNYKHFAEFMRDQEPIMDREEERRRHEDEERYDEEESVMETSFPESAVSQEHQVIYSELPLRGDTLTLPTLVQRQADTMHITSTGRHDREVFANMITYSYRTRSTPQLKTVTGELTHVLNTLYIRINGLEKLNTDLSDMLGNAHAALILERQGGQTAFTLFCEYLEASSGGISPGELSVKKDWQNKHHYLIDIRIHRDDYIFTVYPNTFQTFLLSWVYQNLDIAVS